MIARPDDILTFWTEAGAEKWWQKDDRFDATIRHRFLDTHQAASNNELGDWTGSPGGTLALIIVLDQFSRNLFRNDARAFAQDEACLKIVHDIMASGQDRLMPADIGMFAYLPLMHSENISDQERCIVEMERLGLEDQVKYAVIHRDIIAKFGRFPHRNTVLGRTTTGPEQAFLDEGGFSG